MQIGAAAALLGLSEAEGDVLEVEGQPLAANLLRLAQALDYLGSPLPEETGTALRQAAEARDTAALQNLFDPLVLATVEINPELRVKAIRGQAKATLQQFGYTPLILKVHNLGQVSGPLHITSPQAGAVYAGPSPFILQRQAQTELLDGENIDQRKDRFFDVEVFTSSPMTQQLSGLEVEYVIALASSSEAGKREALLQFDVGQGTQDLGFRSDLPVLFEVRPAVALPLRIRDVDGSPTVARLTFRDHFDRVYPPQPKRLAPDLFFQPHIYRADGENVLLPPGEFTLTVTRGPEYLIQTQRLTVTEETNTPLEIVLNRWIDPRTSGYYPGDHHIHGAGCSHYTTPMEGVLPEHMFRQVKGEGLAVGCVLTWGPCYDFQRRFFEASPNALSDGQTLIKYDVEVSGFGSAAMGHVCLLNLQDQTYPGSGGSKEVGWPSWTVPVMRWCKDQGGVTGYPHSAMSIDPEVSVKAILQHGDLDEDGSLDIKEAATVVLPASFLEVDGNGDGVIDREELLSSSNEAADRLPNHVLPAMDGKGAMEIVVSVPEGVCDFVSAMDTERLPEWNTWYHLMNCGFPLKLSGETDFPCMSSRRVGQGRVYVDMGAPVEAVDFSAWVRALAEGRSYVSDGFAHALDFQVDGVDPGPAPLQVAAGAVVSVEAEVAFAPELPKAVAYGTEEPAAGRRVIGDTVNLHAPRNEERIAGVEHLVELVVNGEVRGSQMVAGDGQRHPIRFAIPLEDSAWVALRSFPQLHTNPVTVLVDERPIRASTASARWCELAVKLLWERRSNFISEEERPAARAAYERAMATYQRIASEATKREKIPGGPSSSPTP